jgi:DNA-binding NtrC family response regulator
VRIIAATNKDIKQMIAENTFRQDLFYRLSVLPVHLPPLRDRREDIPLLVRHFLEKESLTAGLLEKKVTPRAMQSLVSYSWPGNIRELENLIRYLMVTTQDEDIDAVNIPLHVRHEGVDLDHFAGPDTSPTVSSVDFAGHLSSMTWPQLEKEYVTSLLEKNNWNITWAAKTSGINRSTFASRMRKLKIKRLRREFE